jgi:hypothetical protein
MARWTDLAVWRGPTVNCGDGDQYPNEGEDRMREQRGLVIHIAEGYYEGTIGYQKNSDVNVSSHFVLAGPRDIPHGGRDGQLAQVVDTDIAAWTQRAGNGHWLSVECSGFTPDKLSPAQLESVAQLLARAHREYGVPLQIAYNPQGRGLGHHSMGTNGHSVPTDNWTGATWGHEDCPGPAIVGQKPAIVARAIQIVNGGDDVSAADVWAYRFKGKHPDGTPYDFSAEEMLTGANQAAWRAVQLLEAAAGSGGTVPPGAVGLTAEALQQIQAIVDQELDEQSRAGADNDA